MEKQVKLSERSWSYKLIRMVFGINPKRFNNFCPYFWLTVTGLIVFLPSILIKTVSLPFIKILEIWENYRYESFLKSLSKSQLYFLKYDPRCDYEVRGVFFNKFLKIPKLNSEILKDAIRAKKISSEDIDKYEKDWITDVEKLSGEITKRNKRIDEAILIVETIFSWISIVVIVLFGFIVTVALITIIYHLFGVFKLNEFLLTLTAIIVFFSHIKGIELSFKYWGNRENVGGLEYLYIIPLWTITSPILLVWFFLADVIWKNGVIRFGGIFGKYLESAYEDYCPGIDWEGDKK